mmetsp:Transcript_22347/g.26906  ORF Transcript_22347/g.26906 Transcript_22347/m.26906 type:complete len:137 (+) Transcript_22347:3-413(+)
MSAMLRPQLRGEAGRLAFNKPLAAPFPQRSVRPMASAAGDNKKHFMLTYTYVPDILEKRGPYRAEHLSLAQAQIDEGNMLMAGPLAEPVDGAMFLWNCDNTDMIEEFVKNDSYVKGGLVPSYTIREWSVLLRAKEI